MSDDLGWLENIRAEFLARRNDYPSCSGAFSSVDNAINRLQDELREHAAEDDMPATTSP
jgi:hypothetical protein